MITDRKIPNDRYAEQEFIDLMTAKCEDITTNTSDMIRGGLRIIEKYSNNPIDSCEDNKIHSHDINYFIQRGITVSDILHLNGYNWSINVCRWRKDKKNICFNINRL